MWWHMTCRMSLKVSNICIKHNRRIVLKLGWRFDNIRYRDRKHLTFCIIMLSLTQLIIFFLSVSINGGKFRKKFMYVHKISSFEESGKSGRWGLSSTLLEDELSLFSLASWFRVLLGMFTQICNSMQVKWSNLRFRTPDWDKNTLHNKSTSLLQQTLQTSSGENKGCDF